MKIKVKVKPKSGIQEIQPMSKDEYKIFLKKSATENKANIELIKVLTKHFKKKVKIIQGKTSKNKIIEVESGD